MPCSTGPKLGGARLRVPTSLSPATSPRNLGDGFTLFPQHLEAPVFWTEAGGGELDDRLTCRTLRPAAAEAPCPGWWGAERGAGDAEVEAAARFRMWRAFRTISCSICCFDSLAVVRNETANISISPPSSSSSLSST